MTQVLTDWMPRQRWFGGKDREVDRVDLAHTVELADPVDAAGPRWELAIADVHFTGEPDHVQRYQLARNGRPAPDDPGGDDATADPRFGSALLRLITRKARREWVRCTVEPGAEPTLAAGRDLPARRLHAEQSNTSLVFGDRFILKLFRRLAPGTNPDLEVHRALTAAGCPHIAPLLGAIEGSLDGHPTSMGMLQVFLPDAVDGWDLARATVRNLLSGSGNAEFAGEAYQLGVVVARTHRDLAAAFGRSRLSTSDAAAVAAGMGARLDEALRAAPALARYADRTRELLATAATGLAGEPVQRVHGDLHLGQVLRTATGWTVIDFEGEPAAPLPERTALRTPLQDVAGMLRSFDYAGHHELGAAGAAEAEPAVERWVAAARTAFLAGYTETSGVPVPPDDPVLRAFELDKAVYEVAYDSQNRPDQVSVPLDAVRRLSEVGDHG
jgi:maltokinase